MNLVISANVRGVGDGVWAMCGWLENDVLISGNGEWEFGGESESGEGKKLYYQPWYTCGVCVVNQV